MIKADCSILEIEMAPVDFIVLQPLSITKVQYVRICFADTQVPSKH